MIPVTITNPERLPEAERRFHLTCVCKGDLSACPEKQEARAA